MPVISEVNIVFIKPTNGLIGFASVVLDKSFYLSSIGIHQKLDGSGYRLTYPKKQHNGQDMDIYHPINRETSHAIEKAVMTKLNDVMSKRNVRYRSHYIK